MKGETWPDSNCCIRDLLIRFFYSSAKDRFKGKIFNFFII